jgi:fatty acid synthase subunit beta
MKLRALDTLISVTNSLKAEPFAFSSSGINAETLQMIHTCAAQARAKATPLVLSRGVCATPLHGIDMPFHSTFLRSGIGAFRSQLLDSIKKDRIEAQKLVGKWIPNLTGKPFTLTREYFEEVGRLTGSKEVGRLTGSKEVARILKEANPRPTAAFQE